MGAKRQPKRPAKTFATRSEAAVAFHSADHEECRLTKAESDEFVEKHMTDSPLLARLPLRDERMNSSGPNQIAIPIDHFDCGFKFPILIELAMVFDHYGVVPGQISPNSMDGICSFISYLRSERVRFSMDLFRKIFSVRAIPDSESNVFKGHLYFGCRGLKMVNLANKVTAWSERYLIFEGRLGLLNPNPHVRPEEAFQQVAISEVEKKTCKLLEDERLNVSYYIPLLAELENVRPEDTEAIVPANKPVSPAGLILTQTEKRKRQVRNKPLPSDGVDSVSSGDFSALRSFSKVKDLKGRTILSWHPDGDGVQVSTALPHWTNEKSGRHAEAASIAMFGRRNFRRLRRIPEEELAREAVRVGAESLITNVFMGMTFKRLIKANDHLEKEIAELKKENVRLKEAESAKYDETNPVYQRELFPHVAEGIDNAFNRLRELKAFAPGFEHFTFSDAYPILQKKLEKIRRKAKGKNKADESSSEEIDGGDDEAEEPAAAESGESGSESESSGSEEEAGRKSGELSSSSSSGSEGYSPDVSIDGSDHSSTPASKKLRPHN